MEDSTIRVLAQELPQYFGHLPPKAFDMSPPNIADIQTGCNLIKRHVAQLETDAALARLHNAKLSKKLDLARAHIVGLVS